PDTSDLLAVAQDYAQLLLSAITAAPVQPNFYAQVAAHMIDADTAQFNGKYRSVLTGVFVDRNIIAASAVAPLATMKSKSKAEVLGFAKHAATAAPALESHKVEFD